MDGADEPKDKPRDKPLRWFTNSLQTPPVGRDARREAGFLLRRLQRGETLALPESRPMPAIGRRVHELRVDDGQGGVTWRIVYRIDSDAVLVVHWWAKKSRKTAMRDIELCKKRLSDYDKEE